MINFHHSSTYQTELSNNYIYNIKVKLFLHIDWFSPMIYWRTDAYNVDNVVITNIFLLFFK